MEFLEQQIAHLETQIAHHMKRTPEEMAVMMPNSAANAPALLSPRQAIQLGYTDWIEEDIEAQKRKEKTFFDLAERFRAADDPKEVERLGEELGQMVFGR